MFDVTNTVLEAQADKLLTPQTKEEYREAIKTEAEKIINRKMTDYQRQMIQKATLALMTSYFRTKPQVIADSVWLEAVNSIMEGRTGEILAEHAMDMNAKDAEARCYNMARRLFPKTYKGKHEPGILLWLTKHGFLNSHQQLQTNGAGGILKVDDVIGVLADYFNPRQPIPTIEHVADTIQLESTREAADVNKGVARDLGSANFGDPVILEAPNAGESTMADHSAHFEDFCNESVSDNLDDPHSRRSELDKLYYKTKDQIEGLADSGEITHDLADQEINSLHRQYTATFTALTMQAEARDHEESLA